VDAAAGQVAGGFGKATGDVFKSAVGGNGQEFAELKNAVECAVYFRHPHSSLEKGTSDHPTCFCAALRKKGEAQTACLRR
jgi:IS30 family transposase